MEYTFESYLQEKHAEQYMGLDDEMPDNYSNWLCELCADEWITYGQSYGYQKGLRLLGELQKNMERNSPEHCETGMDHCIVCGKTYEYKVSGCTCGNSFTS